MNVASLDLCKELHELSEWDNPDELDSYGLRIENDVNPFQCPAYNLGYLLRKLPRKLNGVNSKQRDGNFNLYASRGKATWVASYADADGSVIRRLKKDAESQNNRNFWFVHGSADTPEDAACKLAIQLFKQDILQRDGIEVGHDPL